MGAGGSILPGHHRAAPSPSPSKDANAERPISTGAGKKPAATNVVSNRTIDAPGRNEAKSDSTSSFDKFTDAHYLTSFRDWVTGQRNGMAPLHAAIMDNNEPLARLLIENGAHISFQLPEDESLKAEITEKIKLMGFEQILLLSPTVWGSANSKRGSNVLHDAAKRGDAIQLIEGLIKNLDVWERDEAGNLPLYYACLHGHAVCCSWIIIAMGGVERIPLNEIERCTINSLDARTKNLLKKKVETRGIHNQSSVFYLMLLYLSFLLDVIHRSMRVDELDRPKSVENNIFSQLGEDEVLMGNLFGNEGENV
jgi:hypothetical protein